MAPIRVAAIQASSCAYSLKESIDKLSQLVSKASRDGQAQLLVFPEAFLSAYPRPLGFAIGSRAQEQRDWYTKYLDSAVQIPTGAVGKRYGSIAPSTSDGVFDETDELWAFRTICVITEDYKVVPGSPSPFLSQFLSIGILERSLVGATLWWTNIVVSPESVLLSLHRKLQPTACEHVVWSQGHAWNKDQQESNLQVAHTPIGKIGGLICWEDFMPLPRYALYRKGVEIWTAPTADARPTWAPSMQHIRKGGASSFPVSSIISYRSEKSNPEFILPPLSRSSPQQTNTISPPTSLRTIPPTPHKAPEASKAELWSRGGSIIVDPFGTISAGPLWGGDGILYATIDVATIPRTKLDFDPVGHYAREDLFNFSVPTGHP
ncbi:BQ2448_3749 [Microbotryum intermedium]|uniref:BQ2448_3749 protein n=1 Tax=Microbotryum intermedium TaxID=269621 RepID=A0A238FCS6_9BASI|nr:BQ2448_3749 [Microbotryum intermedium]